MTYRRIAPAIYRGARGHPHQAGSLPEPDGRVERVRRMNDSRRAFDRRRARRDAALELMAALAAAIAALHAGAERRHDKGGRAGVQWVVEGNAARPRRVGHVCSSDGAPI